MRVVTEVDRWGVTRVVGGWVSLDDRERQELACQGCQERLQYQGKAISRGGLLFCSVECSESHRSDSRGEGR